MTQCTALVNPTSDDVTGADSPFHVVGFSCWNRETRSLDRLGTLGTTSGGWLYRQQSQTLKKGAERPSLVAPNSLRWQGLDGDHAPSAEIWKMSRRCRGNVATRASARRNVSEKLGNWHPASENTPQPSYHVCRDAEGVSFLSRQRRDTCGACQDELRFERKGKKGSIVMDYRIFTDLWKGPGPVQFFYDITQNWSAWRISER